MSAWTHPEIADWEALGRVVDVAGDAVFVVDAPATDGDDLEPLLVIHGFPTSSFDFAHLLPALRRRRRVVLFDMIGCGLSAKPDAPYTIALQADAAMAVTAALGVERMALLTHDMGDTVGGELLARQTGGEWPVEVTRRVVTNGSIYIDMAHLTDGQNLLLSLPDAKLDADLPVERLAGALVATLAPGHADIDMGAHAELQHHAEGDRILPRLIRYIEERRANERRFTGAIETHPSPLHVVWGPEDPIAVAGMADQLAAVRPDATLTWIDGAGHYPQIEAPDAYLAALDAALS